MATDETTSSTQPVAPANESFSSVLSEKRKFPPPAEFAKAAHISSMEEYEKLYAAADADPEAYWGGINNCVKLYHRNQRKVQKPAGRVAGKN